MEAPPQIRDTLDYVYTRTPEAHRIAVGIHFGTLPPSAADDREDVARYAAYVARQLQPRVRLNSNSPAAPLRMNFASCYVQDHDEDSHFFHAVAGVIGVADGVGGCRSAGVDAAAFSRGLMGNAFSEVSASDLGKPVCPYTILDRAYQRTAASGTPGASTAVIVSLAGKALRWAYIGDSGFALFRDGKLLHRSEPQQHYFNCPFQLFAGEGSHRVSGAAVGEIAVEEGDVLVVASDGLFDNVFDSTLERTVQMGTAFNFTPQHMADIMAGQAHNASMDASKDSPFSVAAREHGLTCTGGKQDDITVVVAFVESQDDMTTDLPVSRLRT
uniref:Uncharacterized protein n=1 Tax=Avena sativa TaxID=4498 RepID=A0ACD5ZRH6_AVESA